jgi:carbon monoxide dehydrogenase subunit G
MELGQEVRINAHRDRVYASLNDVEILKQAIPGCEELTQDSQTEFSATVVSKIGPVKAKFKGSVTLSDLNPPQSYTMTGQGTGGVAGFAKMCATVDLAEDGDATVMIYCVKATVGGKLAQIGGRLIDTAAKKMADEFCGRFEALVIGQSENGVGGPDTVA